MRRSLVFVVAVTMFLAVVGVPSVGAAKPEVIDEFEFMDGPYPWRDLSGEVVTCKDGAWNPGGVDSDFTVLHSIVGSVVHTHTTIRNGAAEKHQTWVSGTDYLTNSGDDSKVASGDFNVMDLQFVDLATGEETPLKIHGLGWHVVAPGFGTVFIEAGTLTLDFSLPGDPFVSFTGTSDVGAFEYDAVCEALS